MGSSDLPVLRLFGWKFLEEGGSFLQLVFNYFCARFHGCFLFREFVPSIILFYVGKQLTTFVPR